MKRLAPIIAFLLASCASAPKVDPQPHPTTLDEAEIARRVAMDAAHVAAVQRQEALFLWALGIGGLVAMIGLALLLASVVFRLGKTWAMAGAGAIVFGVTVASIAIAFPHYGEQIALGAAILVALVLAFAGYIGVTVALEWRKALIQTVKGVDAAKEVMPVGVKESVFAPDGPLAASMTDKTKRMVAVVRNKIKEKK